MGPARLRTQRFCSAAHFMQRRRSPEALRVGKSGDGIDQACSCDLLELMKKAMGGLKTLIRRLCQMKMHHDARFRHRFVPSVSNIVELLKQHNCKMTAILLTEDVWDYFCCVKSFQGAGRRKFWLKFEKFHIHCNK